MTAKTRRGAANGKAAAADKKATAKQKAPKQTKEQVKEQVVEVSDDAKAIKADADKDISEQAPPKAPAPDQASTAQQDSGASEASDNGNSEPEVTAEEQAEETAEKIVDDTQKPLRKNSSSSSLAGSVTVRVILSNMTHCNPP